MFSIRHAIVSTGIAVVLAVVAVSPAFATDTKTISAVKNCSTWRVTATCVITASDPLKSLIGSVITYGGGPGPHQFDLFGVGTDVELVTAQGQGSAPGFCRLNAAIGVGHCTFSNGTGRLNTFTADLVVTNVGSGNWTLSGTYSFGLGQEGNGHNDEN